MTTIVKKKILGHFSTFIDIKASQKAFMHNSYEHGITDSKYITVLQKNIIIFEKVFCSSNFCEFQWEVSTQASVKRGSTTVQFLQKFCHRFITGTGCISKPIVL